MLLPSLIPFFRRNLAVAPVQLLLQLVIDQTLCNDGIAHVVSIRGERCRFFEGSNRPPAFLGPPRASLSWCGALLPAPLAGAAGASDHGCIAYGDSAGGVRWSRFDSPSEVA